MAAAVDDDVSNRFKQMTVDSKDINILLMGETGVGKSTFINSFANYIEYDKFNIAEKSEVRCLIPSTFTVTDENMEPKTITIGKDKNESEEAGESATQGARSYVFPLQKYQSRIRLIDTPGIGDTRGIDQDNINFENILHYISNMEYLHGICFLLKPNNSRLTVFFEYCIKQLLSRLEKSASKNIIFLFTNSRSTFYRPGDTGPAIKKILTQVKDRSNVDISFAKHNIFCLDNEAFRFMVSCKKGIQFTNEDKQSFSKSWQESVKECWRMIDYITGKGAHELKINPHKVKDTISVNSARRIIIHLSQPLADIAELINDNINLLQRHNNALQRENLSKEDLKSRLYVPVINLRHIELKQPTTICTNKDCCEIYMVGGKRKYHYKQRCHDPCYLRNVPQEIIGSPELIHCYAINPATKQCKECNCDFSAHMHIYYLTETYQDKITDVGIKTQITDRETAAREAQKLIGKIEVIKAGYEKEKEVIAKSMAKFAHFLQHNAIAPYNDAYKGYLKYLIDRENSYGQDADLQLIRYYQDLLSQYDEEKLILDNAIQMCEDGSSTSIIKASDIFAAVEDLFDLKHTGLKIRELHEKQTNSRNAEFESNTEYVLEESVSQNRYRNIDPSIKKVKSKGGNKKRSASVQGFGNKSDSDQLDSKDNKNDFNQKKTGRNYANKDFKAKIFDNQNKKRQNFQGQDTGDKGQRTYNNQNQQKGLRNQTDYNQKRAPNLGQNTRNGPPLNQGQGVNHQRKYQNSQGQNLLDNYGQRPYSQGSGPHNQGQYNQMQHPYNVGPGPYNQGPGPYNQGPGPNYHGPGPYNQGPGPNYHGPGPYNHGPGVYNQGPGPYNHGPGPYNQGPGPNYHGPGPYNHGPGVYNQGPGPYNHGPGPYNQGPGPYNQEQQGPSNQNQGEYSHNQGQASYNGGHGPNSREQRPRYQTNNHRQEYNQDGTLGSDTQEQGQVLSDEGRFGKSKNQSNMSEEQNFSNSNMPLNNRPMGPYKPDVNEKKSNIQLKHLNNLLSEFEEGHDNYDNDDAEEEQDYRNFMAKHGLESQQKDVAYKKNNKGGNFNGKPRGRGGNRGGRGYKRSGSVPKSLDKYAFDSDSDSGQSCNSRTTTKSSRDDFRKPDTNTFHYVQKQEGNQMKSYQYSQNDGCDSNQGKKGVMDFFKSIFD